MTDKKEGKKIKKDMLIGDILKVNMEAAGLMMESGLHCVGCMVASQETLEQGCQAHGMDDKQIDELVKKINELKTEKVD